MIKHKDEIDTPALASTSWKTLSPSATSPTSPVPCSFLIKVCSVISAALSDSVLSAAVWSLAASGAAGAPSCCNSWDESAEGCGCTVFGTDWTFLSSAMRIRHSLMPQSSSLRPSSGTPLFMQANTRARPPEPVNIDTTLSNAGMRTLAPYVLCVFCNQISTSLIGLQYFSMNSDEDTA
jgi:hypothetical protein